MDPERLLHDDEKPIFINKTVNSHIDETSNLIFAFDNDIGMADDAVNTTHDKSHNVSLQSLSPITSSSPSEYVMISHPWHKTGGDDAETEIYESDVLEMQRTIRNDQRGQRAALSSDTLSIFPLSLPELAERSNMQQQPSQSSSPSHLQALQSSAHSTHSPTLSPEPITPRTRKFQSNMLSMLSLLPPGRYLSPSPSSVEEQHPEDDRMVWEHVGASSPDSSVYEDTACPSSRAVPLEQCSSSYALADIDSPEGSGRACGRK